MLCHDNGVNVHSEGLHEVEGSEEHVGKLYRHPLRLARARDSRLGWMAHHFTVGGKGAPFRAEGARSINERLPVPVFLQRLRYLRMDQAKGLRDGGWLFPPPMSDGVGVDFLCESVYVHFPFSFSGEGWL